MNNLPFVLVVPLLIGLVICSPWLTHPSLFFGVTVEPTFRKGPVGGRIFRIYAVQVALHGAIGLALGLIAPQLSVVGILWLAAGSMIAFFIAHRQTKPHAIEPAAVHQASLRLSRERVPLGWIGGVLPLVAIASAGAYQLMNMDLLPPTYPVHWGLQGPDRFVTTSATSIIGFTLVGLLLAGTMLFSIVGINESRRVSMQGRPAVFEDKFRRVNSWILLIAEYMIALIFAGLPLTVLHGGGMFVTSVLLASVVATFALAIYSIRLKTLQWAEPGDQPVGDRTPDACWKLGQFYYNPSDPVLFVEKRFGVGYTLNFGNWRAWALLGGLLVVPFLFTILIR